MTHYIEWGTVSNLPGGLHRETLQKVDPTDLSTVQALWSALPPDLRLALAKTAPKVAGKWVELVPGSAWGRGDNGKLATVALVNGDYRASSVKFIGCFPTLASAQAACDDALLAQGYVLDGDTP